MIRGHGFNSSEIEGHFSLAALVSDDKLLLGRKTRGYGRGKLVLPGGKDQYFMGNKNIDIFAGNRNAQREVLEETGLMIDSDRFRHAGVLYVATDDDNKDIQIYHTNTDHVEPDASSELIDPAWHPIDQLPYDEMPEDYRFWLPSILDGYVVIAFLETDIEDRLIAAQVMRQQIEPLGRLEEIPTGI
jgi:8-oxo-dGTP diphosphatase